MLGYWLAGLWVPAVTRYYLVSLPAILGATLLGRAVNGKFRVDVFLVLINVWLVAVGASLLAGSVWSR
jgi:hypothetical protein